MMDLVYLNEFFDDLKFDLELIYHKGPKSNELPTYSINDEKIYVYFKNEVRPHNVPIIKQQKEKLNLPLMVASKYITPNAKKILVTEDINYIDSYGNAHFNLKKLNLHIEKGNAKPITNEYSSVFTLAGGQLIFQILKNPKSVNETMRFLAENSLISLGSVSNIMKGMMEDGYLIHWSNENKYQLVRKKELLDRWIPLVNEKILPKYKVGSYSFSNNVKNEWRTKFSVSNVFWGGEPAAAILTKYLYPQNFTLFTKYTKKELMTKLKLVPSEKGDITVFRPFWLNESLDSQLNFINKKNIVHPILIYAQLVYSGDDRNLEVAQIIYNEYIRPNI